MFKKLVKGSGFIFTESIVKIERDAVYIHGTTGYNATPLRARMARLLAH